MNKSEQAYRDFYHKIKASVSLDEWNAIWNFIERQWKGDSPIAMVTTEKKRGDGTWQSDITWTVRDQPPLDTPLYVHPPGVFLDFDQLGIAGPFPVIGEKVSVPAVTISDLVRMAAPVAQEPVVTDEMVTRFLGWHLPQDFAPDAGISFNPSPDSHSWPVGTNLLTDPQARAMLEYVLQGAPAAAQAQPCPVDRSTNLQGQPIAHDHPEATCEKCGGPNIVWFADSKLWNAHSGERGILCPICFAQQAEANGFVPTAWVLGPEGQPSAQDREDAERWREVAERFDQAKTSACERVLEALGLDGADAAKSLDLVIDAARAAKGE